MPRTMRSVPHRGSGWVLLALSQSSKSGKSVPDRSLHSR